VKKGSLIGRMEAGDLGANIHASMAGAVETVTDAFVEIRR